MDTSILNEVVDSQAPTRTYYVMNNRIIGFVDELGAMRQAVEKILSTERFDHVIYTDAYGIEISSLIGESIDLVKMEVERIITEALIVDDRIVEIIDFKIDSVSNNELNVSFTVVTIFGELYESKEVSV